MKEKIYLSFLFIFIFISTANGGEIWVSTLGHDTNTGTNQYPFRTIERALKEAREWRRLSDSRTSGGIYIHIKEGEYTQEKPLFIRPEDSGTASSPTYIQSAKKEKVVISGGREVTGWEKVTYEIPGLPAKAKGNIWVAEAPMRGNRHIETRQLWVNGKKAFRTSQFEYGKMEHMINFITEKEEIWIPTPENIFSVDAKQMEMVVHQRWATAILRVKNLNIQGDKTKVTFHQPESYLEFSHPWPQPVINGEKGNSSFYLCNAIQFLDEPGEWFQEYPSGKIYYYPRQGEDMLTAKAIIPALEQIVLIDGSPERPVSHVYFNGISFEYAGCFRPSLQGHVTLQGGMYLLDAYKLQTPGLPEKAELENQAWIARPESAITVKGADHINFTGCTFRHLASTGLDYEWAIKYCKTEGCFFTDIGGSAILLGTFPDKGFETHVPYIPQNPAELCSHISISNNLITEVTNEDWGCVGIGAGYVSDIHIEHNEISHLNYSGICVGWGWTKLNSGMKNNRIHANYVHHFARQLYDAGGIYTLSSQPGSSITNNRIEYLVDAPYATNDRAFYIYFDEATNHYLVENNWCPKKRFDSNSPGPDNKWKNNGPEVSESIKQAAGLTSQWKHLQNK